MLLKTHGKPHLIEDVVVARVTRDVRNQNEQQVLISEETLPKILSSFVGVITNLPLATNMIDIPSVYEVATTDHLFEGDIVSINSDGVINTLFRPYSPHNFLLLTERCNSNCLMCSQPPKDRNDTNYLYQVYDKLIPLIPKDCYQLGITGGEPTLLGERFFQLLSMIKVHLPNTFVHCLTNGRSFAWCNIADKLADLDYRNLMLAIPLYSDYYKFHDYIVQARDAFHQTIRGIYHLAERNQRIEIRVVLHKETIPRLAKLARYIYRNLPFVEHVTFMGLEHQGYTPHNIDILWIDPADYIKELQEAVLFLNGVGMNVSIYNSQLCVLPECLWPFMRQSISDWKNIYLKECEKCIKLQQCGGFFASNAAKHSAHIKAFSE
jgi:His-Xaa-Ser system radical SAM maturase HxsC